MLGLLAGGRGGGRGATTNDAAALTIGHFDHTFTAALEGHEPEDMLPPRQPAHYRPEHVQLFGEDARIVDLICKRDQIVVEEEVGTNLGDMRRVQLASMDYASMDKMTWDHSVSSVKISCNASSFLILRTENSLELENEFSTRFKGIKRTAQTEGRQTPRVPYFEYVGMYAGPSKPKPFQRKRANLSTRAQGKLPSLHTMRELAVNSHQGSGKPKSSAESRRMQLALEHIHKGFQTFAMTDMEGITTAASDPFKLQLSGEHIRVLASDESMVWEDRWDELVDYEIVDELHNHNNRSGVKFFFPNRATGEGEKEVFFIVEEVRLLMFAIEHFYNRSMEASNRPAKRQSTHGRRVITMSTLTGTIDAPEAVAGDRNITDQSGKLIRPANPNAGVHAMSAISSTATSRGGNRRKSLMGSMLGGGGGHPATENRDAIGHWNEVVRHQGWLLKKGGLTKSWLRRYAVLYTTAQGHFLSYYSDYSESPLYSTRANERNMIDLSKTTFIRPITNLEGAPAHAFDISTIEREWTLCTETHESMQEWLQILTRVIDEDVAVVPDDELAFVVKTRTDPSGQLVKNEYATCMKVSAAGVSVNVMKSGSIAQDELSERFFWCYTDFFKWSLIHHQSKMAIKIEVFVTADFDMKTRQEFLFRTRDAPKLASAIEFYIEKFMSIMHLWLECEIDDQEAQGGAAADGGAGGAGAGAGGMNMATEEEFEAAQAEADLLSGYDSDEHEQDAIAAQQAGSTNPFDPDDVVGGGGGGGAAEMPTAPASLFPVVEQSAPPPAPAAGVPNPFDGPTDLFNAPAATAAAGPTDDFGFPTTSSDPFAVAPVAATGPMTIDPALQPQIDLWFQGLLTEGRAMLFENNVVAIRMVQEYRGSQGRIVFTMQNKMASTIVDIQPQLTVAEASALRYEIKAMFPTVAPNGLVDSTLMVECMQPYQCIPELNMKFTADGQAYDYTLKVPLHMTKFIMPRDMTLLDFQATWARMEGAGQSQLVFNSPAPINSNQFPARVAALTKFKVVQNIIQPNPNVVEAVGQLPTGTRSAQGNIVVGCLMRVEINPAQQALRLTLRTQIPTVSSAMCEVVKLLLSS